MAIFDLADRVKKFISGEISNNKKNEAFDQIQQATGVPIDEKQRAAIIKANVDPNMLNLVKCLILFIIGNFTRYKFLNSIC